MSLLFFGGGVCIGFVVGFVFTFCWMVGAGSTLFACLVDFVVKHVLKEKVKSDLDDMSEIRKSQWRIL